MAKSRKRQPKFLLTKLSDKTMAFVKSHMPSFLDTARDEKTGTYPANMELLYQFVDYLGEIRDTFHNIDHDALITTSAGVLQIYEALRKRVATRADASPSGCDKDKKKPTPDKAKTRADAVKSEQIIQQENPT